MARSRVYSLGRGRVNGKCRGYDIPTPAIAARLRAIHEQLAQRIARNDPGLDIIDAL